MIDFIVKYWVEFLFGLIISGATVAYNFIARQIKKNRQEQVNNQLDTLYVKITDSFNEKMTALQEEDKNINNRIDQLHNDLEIMRDGILSLHRRRFVDDCRKLLNQESEITQEDYERLKREHRTYNALGGNHEGDEMYNLFLKKYEAQLVK